VIWGRFAVVRVPYRWELVAWLWLAFLLNQADRQLFNVVLPQLQTDLGLSDVQAGLIASAFTMALAVMVPIAGYAGDRLARHRIVVGSLFAWSLATAVTGLAGGVWFLLIVRSLATGVGEGCYAPSANALIGAHHTTTRARAMAIYQTSLYVGVIGSGVAGGALADRFGWRTAFWVFGAAGVMLAVALALRLRRTHIVALEERPTAVPSALVTVRRVLRTPTVAYFLVACCAMIFVNVGYLTWMPTFMHERFGLSLAAAGFSSLFAHHVGAFVGVLVGGWWSDRRAPRRPQIRFEVQAWALLGGAPFLFMLGLADSVPMVHLALAGFGFCRGAYDANTYPVLFGVVEPRLHASASGLVIAIAFSAGSLAPVALAVVKGRAGLATGLSSLALVYVVGGVIALVGAVRTFMIDFARAQQPIVSVRT